MGSYLPSTAAQRQEMLAAVGCQSPKELFSAIPPELRLQRPLNLPQGLSELETARRMEELSGKNTRYRSIFRGAGAYHHYIPAVVKGVASKETFLTAYTPYQAELSQGILQSIFEYQTMICELTGLDVSNASVYDGASAAAEAAAMCRDRKRTGTLVSATAHPDVIETVRCYCWATDTPFALVPAAEGVTDLDALASMVGDSTACVYLQQPNFYGLVENTQRAGEITHAAGAKYIVGVNPIAATVLKSPGECGADIAVGEGQPLGMPLSFGGPYLGFMAATSAMMRKLPGRIVGETTDVEGRRAFVLTLQAREQHIRREKASSNICSNQALCALTAAAYMASMGAGGMKEAAVQCTSKAHYLAQGLEKAGLERVHGGEFFHEFLTRCPVEPGRLLQNLEQHGILGGFPVEGGILWCATELNSKADMDRLIQLVGEVCGQ